MKHFENGQLLTTVNWLQQHVNDNKLIVLDARATGYEDGHIPNAISLKPGQLVDRHHDVDGYIVDAEAFTKIAQAIGIHKDSSIVVYDNGDLLNAARIFYALEYYGLQDQVSLLNGGFLAWVAAELTVSTDVPTITPGNFVAQANETRLSTRAFIEQSLDSPDVVIVDTRSAAEFNGTELKNNKNGGHIPGATHFEWTQVLSKKKDGIFELLPSEKLRTKFENAGITMDKTIIPYCQSNVRASNSYFVLRLLGYSSIRSYEGSWAEWGNADGVPIDR